MSTIDIRFNPTTLYVIVGILIGTNFIIYTPIIIYYAAKFWKLRNESFFRKRHPYFVIAKVIGLQIWMCIPRSIYWFSIFAKNTSPIIFVFNDIFLNIAYPIFGLVLIRFWWLYFDYSRSWQLKTLKWKQNIVQEMSEPWTLKYKYLGTRKFLSRTIIIYAIIVIVSIQF